jgi:hypothetical protein
MALKKDKEKVLDEVWTTERVRDFLAVKPAEEVEADFHVLLKAYQSMRLENFEEFIAMFIAEGRNLSAKNAEGQTALSIIKEHKASTAYATILESNGAQ